MDVAIFHKSLGDWERMRSVLGWVIPEYLRLWWEEWNSLESWGPTSSYGATEVSAWVLKLRYALETLWRLQILLAWILR